MLILLGLLLTIAVALAYHKLIRKAYGDANPVKESYLLFAYMLVYTFGMILPMLMEGVFR